MKKRYDKKTYKQLRELASLAHERELAAGLKKLHEDFAAWQAGKIDAFELNERIHQFHQKTSRDIWKMYSYGGEDMLVARALRFGFLAEDEVGGELAERLGPMIDYWQDDISGEG